MAPAIGNETTGVPTRTCVGCRARAPKKDLVRLVVRGDDSVVDRRQTMPGRGAYLHDDEACLATAQKRRAIARALRLGVGTTGIVLPSMR